MLSSFKGGLRGQAKVLTGIKEDGEKRGGKSDGNEKQHLGARRERGQSRESNGGSMHTNPAFSGALAGQVKCLQKVLLGLVAGEPRFDPNLGK